MYTEEQVKALNYDHHTRMQESYRRNAAKDKTKNDTVRKTDKGAFDLLVAPIGKLMEGNRVLELGCSTCHVFPHASEIFGVPIKNISGIDVYEPSVSIGKKLGYDCCVGFIEELPWENGTFSVVFSHHVMEHTYDVQKTLSEVFRVLRRGGWVAAITPAYQPDPEPAHIQQHNLATWKAFYEKAGFIVQSSYNHHGNCYESHILARKP